MGIGYALGNAVLAVREYENWTEVLASIVKRREPDKVILKNGFRVETEIGLRFLVRDIFFEKIYTPFDLPIEDDDLVVDIGANCGVFTLFAASRTRNAVHAFEPSPGNFEVLQRNIALNGLHHVIAHCSAVSDKVGSARLFLNSADCQQNLLSDHILPDKIEQYKDKTDVKYLISGPEQTEAYIEVSTTSLQEFMDSNKIEQIDFLKIDCEGAEGVILHSTPQAYLKRIRKIAMEFHDHLSQWHHSDIQKLLEDVGFTVRLKWDKKSPLGYIYGRRD